MTNRAEILYGNTGDYYLFLVLGLIYHFPFLDPKEGRGPTGMSLGT